MSRRARGLIFYAALAALAAVFAVAAFSERRDRGASPEQDDVVARATVDTTRTVTTIPRSFLGISIEYPDVPVFTGGPGAGSNRAFAGLLANLSSPDSGSPVVRVGGVSTDFSWWNPNDRPKPLGVIYDVKPGWLAGLRSAARATNSPVILSLNLAQRDPAVGADLARAAVERLGPDTVESFELGNEPDYFALRPLGTDRSGKTRMTRPRDYSFDDYLRDFDRQAAALRAQAPPPALAGPGFCCTPGAGWSSMTPDFLRREAARIKLVTNHGYPLLGCQKDPEAFNYPTVAALLAERSSHGFARALAPLVRSARAHKRPYRMSEMNSVACGGRAGVSDTFASALWTADVAFELASVGVVGVNFHSGQESNRYTPFWFEPRGRRLVANVRPEYYGMLLFARTTAGGGSLLALRGDQGSKLKLWAVRDRRGTIRVAALNKDPGTDRLVELRLAGRTAGASLHRLVAPSVSARTGVTFAGQSIPPRSPDGRLRGRPTTESVPARAGRYRFRVERGSAALLTIPRDFGRR